MEISETNFSRKMYYSQETMILLFWLSVIGHDNAKMHNSKKLQKGFIVLARFLMAANLRIE